MPKVSILTCALVMHSVGMWLQGSGCVEEQLFHTREINTIPGSCEVQVMVSPFWEPKWRTQSSLVRS